MLRLSSRSWRGGARVWAEINRAGSLDQRLLASFNDENSFDKRHPRCYTSQPLAILAE